MPYLLDSNVFIEAKNKYYQFSLCPGFWDWLIRENANGKIFSHDGVLNELACRVRRRFITVGSKSRSGVLHKK